MSQISGPSSGGGGGGNITITGDTGGPLGPAAAFTFLGGTTGLSFNGVGTTETLQFAGILANGGSIELGTDGGDDSVDIGTNTTNGRTMQIGNQIGTTSMLIQAGSNGCVIEPSGGMNICASAFDGQMSIGTGAATGRAITIGNQIGTTSVLITAGSNGCVIEPVGGMNICNTGFDGPMSIGTGANTGRTITIGNSIGTTSVLVQGGSNGIGVIATGDINIATDATDGQLNIGTMAATARTILMGSTVGASQVVIQSGTAGIRTPQVFGFTVGVSGIPVVVDNVGTLGTIVSSSRYKENITDMGSSTEDIFRLRPVTFTMKKDIEKSICWGLIAEEVEKIYPELVSYGKNGEVVSVKYLDLPVMLLNELQKLKKEVSELKAKVK